MTTDQQSAPQTAPRAGTSTGTWILRAVFILFAIYILTEIALNPGKRQWDFRSYYFAGTIAAQDGNPYDGQILNQVSSGTVVLPFVYPPITLPVFELFARFDFHVAYEIWYVLKLILTLLLLYLWRKHLFGDISMDVFAWFMLLAFGATLYIDLVTGNVTMIEQVLIWGGLIALLRERTWLFALLIVVAALFKVTPLLFLAVLPLLSTRNGWRYVGVSVAAIIVVVGVGYALNPDAWNAFFGAVLAADEPGQLGNPSTLAFARDMIASIGDKAGVRIPQALSYVLYLGVVGVVVAYTMRSIQTLRQSQRSNWNLVAIYMFCLGYALVMPRFKTYSFILVLPPALYLLTRVRDVKSFGLLFAVYALAAATPFPISPYLQYFWRYYPLFLVFLVWILLLRLVDRDAKSATSASAPAT